MAITRSRQGIAANDAGEKTLNQQAVMTLGEVKITNEATGETAHYKAGDAFFVASGTRW